MRCVVSPGCTPTPCHSTSLLGESISHCNNVENQLRIFKVDTSPFDARINILSGDTVVLRSIKKSSMWLNCSSPNKECKISPCTSNQLDNSGSNISDCADHLFTVRGVTVTKKGKTRIRATGKVIAEGHSVQLKSQSEGLYLGCRAHDKKCKVSGTEDCDNETCRIQNFNITYHNPDTD